MLLLLLSWGTKGSDKADSLPTGISKKDKAEESAVIEDVEKTSEDLENDFKVTVERAGA
jgi:chitin synthase